MLPETQDFVTHFSSRYPDVPVTVAESKFSNDEFFSKFERWFKTIVEKTRRENPHFSPYHTMTGSPPVIVVVRETVVYKKVETHSIHYPTKIENTGVAEELSEILEYPVLPSEAKKPENNEVLLILK